jgi:hypothetical protein
MVASSVSMIDGHYPNREVQGLRSSAVLSWTQADGSHPFVDQARIVPRAHMVRVIDTTREHLDLDRIATSFEPCQQAGSHIGGDFELGRPPRLC